MILSSSGVPFVSLPPTPSDETEQQLRQVLKSMDALLDVMWVPTVVWNARHARWEGRYALTCTWPQIDKRWSMVQSGEVPPAEANDILGWLCVDMHDPQTMPMTPEAIQQRVIELLGKIDNTRYPWQQRMLNTAKKNAARIKATRDEALDETHDVAGYYYRQAKNIPQIRGTTFSKDTSNE